MHFGSFPGYYSLATLVPSESLAIYTSINGGHQSLPYTINSLIHTYIMNIAFNESPWLTPEGACKFANQDMDYNVTMNNEQQQPLMRPLVEYVGTYYQPVFGNLSVEETDGKLFMYYGKMEFELRVEHGDVFYTNPTDIEWMMLPDKITFNKKIRSEDEILDVEVPFLERSIIPVFMKLPTGVSASQWKWEMDKSCSKKSSMYLCSSTSNTVQYSINNSIICMYLIYMLFAR